MRKLRLGAHCRAQIGLRPAARGRRGLALGVTDDGTGPPAPRDGGVGLASMRERAEERGGRVEATGSVGDGAAAVRAVADDPPDVVLMDLNLPGTPGLEATRRIAAAHPDTAVLVLTMVDDDDGVLAALRIGARGYVLKGAAQEEVLSAIRTVAASGAVFGAGAAQRVLRGGRSRSHVLAKMQVRDRTQAALRMRGLRGFRDARPALLRRSRLTVGPPTSRGNVGSADRRGGRMGGHTARAWAVRGTA